jgi:hypothetical protein
MSQALRTTPAPRVAAEIEPDDTHSLLSSILSRVDAIGVAQSRPSPVHLRSWEEIERFAEKAAKSGMVPKDYIGKPDAIVIAVQMGSEIGLAPMQSLQNISCINGRPAVWGDAMPGLCRASGKTRSIREWTEGDGDNLTAYCEAIRTDDPHPIVGKFSVAEAKKAALFGKDIWAKYPARMLQMRARGYALRDAFPDVLKGLISAEEASDIPFDATGLTVGVPPIATTKPITKPSVLAKTMAAYDANNPGSGRRDDDIPSQRPAPAPTNGNGHNRTLRMVLDAIKMAVRDAGTEEDLDNLARTDDYRKVMASAPEAAQKEITDAVTARLAEIRQDMAEQLGESGWAPDTQIENDPTLGGVVPDELAIAPDKNATAAAELIGQIKAASDPRAVERVMSGMIATALIDRFGRDRPELAASIRETAAARTAELRAGGG